MSWHWKLMQILKENWHVARKLTYGIQLIFMQAVESLIICTLITSFCQKHIKFRWKNTEELCFITLKSDAKFEEKLTLDSKNDLMNPVNFNLSSGKSENSHFDMLLLSIAYEVSVEKVQNNYLSWNWRAMQSLKRNWHVVSSMTWRI